MAGPETPVIDFMDAQTETIAEILDNPHLFRGVFWEPETQTMERLYDGGIEA